MVVNDVEDDTQTGGVRVIDERAEVVGRPVLMCRRIRKHTVVAPAEVTRKLRYRHQFDGRDARVGEKRKLCDCRTPRPLTRECAGVQLANHLARQLDSSRQRMFPVKAFGIDHLGGAERSVRLVT